MNYFEQTGYTALRLWVYELAVENLRANPHQEKELRLRSSLAEYLKIIKKTGSVDDENFIKSLISQLQTEQFNGYIRKNEIGPLELKLWFFELALDALEKTPNKEKTGHLNHWMDTSAYTMLNIYVDVKVKFIRLRKRLKKIIAS